MISSTDGIQDIPSPHTIKTMIRSMDGIHVLYYKDIYRGHTLSTHKTMIVWHTCTLL